jgi:pimeloyl-ACP methyl ester carboxylesterase
MIRMSKLIKLLKLVAYCATLLLALLLLSFFLIDAEPRRLDSQTRANAPGSFVTLDDGVVHYELTGLSGRRTVVLVHGGGPNSYEVLTPLTAALVKENHRVLRYDLYGHGYSDRPKTVYNPDLFDRQLEQLLSKLGISVPLDLVGFSLGGLIAATYAARHPERVRSLTLIAPAGLETHFSLALKLATYPIVGEYLFKVFGRKIVERGFGVMQHAPKYVEHCLHDEMAFLEFEGTRRAALSVLRNMPVGRADVFERVGQQRFPVLAIFGQYDTSVPSAAGTRLKQLIPRLEFHQIANASHGLVYDNGEQVGGFITNVLRLRSSPES